MDITNSYLTSILPSFRKASTEHPRCQTTTEVGERNVLAVLFGYYRHPHGSEYVGIWTLESINTVTGLLTFALDLFIMRY